MNLGIMRLLGAVLASVLATAIAGCGSGTVDPPTAIPDSGTSAPADGDAGSASLEFTTEWVQHTAETGAVVGTVTNVGDRAVEPIVVVDYISADGSALSQDAYTSKRHLLPGETAYFATAISSGVPTEFSASADAEVVVEPAQPLQLTVASENLDLGRGTHGGTVMNDGEATLYDVSVYVVYYDAEGKVLAVSGTESDPSELAPGSTGQFEIWLGYELPLVDHAEVRVDARWAD